MSQQGYGGGYEGKKDHDRALPEYIYNYCCTSGQYRIDCIRTILCTMRDIGIVRRSTLHLQYEVETQEAALKHQQVFDHPGARQFGTTLSGGAGDLLPGGPADAVYYIRRGTVKLTAVSKAGREVVVGLLKAGDFFGEGCLVGKRKHMTTASAMSSTSLLVLKRKEMIRVLHEEPAFSDRFILNILNRKARIEEDLVDQLFNSIEKRLARALLLLASYGKDSRPKKIPKISQKELAKRIGTNLGRVNVFMNKFRKLGYIDYEGEGGIQINPSLLSVVLGD